jgi:hypothetical protein
MRHGSTGSLFHTKALAVRYRTKLLRPSLESGSTSLGTSNWHHCPALHPVSAGLSFCRASGVTQDGRSRFGAVSTGQAQTSLYGALMRPARHCGSSTPHRPSRCGGDIRAAPSVAGGSMRRSDKARQRYVLSGAKGMQKEKPPRRGRIKAHPRGLLRGSPWGAPPRLGAMMAGAG